MNFFKKLFFGPAPVKEVRIVDSETTRERIAFIEPAIARWKDFIREVDGDIVQFMVKVRSESMSTCESFAHHCRRVYYSPTASLRRAFEAAMGDPEYQALIYEMLPSFRRKTILGQWGTQRVIAPLTLEEYQKAVTRKDWRKVSTDFLIENFAPWAIYIKVYDFEDPTGMGRKLGGLYAGFEYHHDEVRLFCQMVGKDLFEPIDYHEFRMPAGSTFGESVDSWKDDMPYRTMLREAFAKEGKIGADKFDQINLDYAHKVGNIVFPLLVTLFQEEPEAKTMAYDTGIGKFVETDEPVALGRYEVNLDFRKVDHLIRQKIVPVVLPG